MPVNTQGISKNHSPVKHYPRMTKERIDGIADRMNNIDGIITEPNTKQKRNTVKCTSCKKRFTEDDIDNGTFIAELSVCDPCLEENAFQ